MGAMVSEFEPHTSNADEMFLDGRKKRVKQDSMVFDGWILRCADDLEGPWVTGLSPATLYFWHQVVTAA